MAIRRRLGRTQIEVTAVGLGCWQFSAGRGMAGKFWEALPPEECHPRWLCAPTPAAIPIAPLQGAPVGGEEQKQWPPGSAGLCETGVDGAEPYAGRIGGKA